VACKLEQQLGRAGESGGGQDAGFVGESSCKQQAVQGTGREVLCDASAGWAMARRTWMGVVGVWQTCGSCGAGSWNVWCWTTSGGSESVVGGSKPAQTAARVLQGLGLKSKGHLRRCRATGKVRQATRRITVRLDVRPIAGGTRGLQATRHVTVRLDVRLIAGGTCGLQATRHITVRLDVRLIAGGTRGLQGGGQGA